MKLLELLKKREQELREKIKASNDAAEIRSMGDESECHHGRNQSIGREIEGPAAEKYSRESLIRSRERQHRISQTMHSSEMDLWHPLIRHRRIEMKTLQTQLNTAQHL